MVYYVQPVEPLGFVHLSAPWPPCRMKLKFARKVSSNLLPQDVGLKDSLTLCVPLTFSNLPWHVFPSPVYPDLQVQIYDPRVLEQLALLSHTGEEALHSSTSEKNNTYPETAIWEDQKVFYQDHW